MPTIDRLDAEILRLLTDDARAGVAEMAERLSVSRNTVQLRMNRLVDQGILKGFRPVIDLAAIGMPVQALVSVELDQRLLGPIVHGLAQLPEVLEVKIQAGREDILVHVAISSLEALQVVTAAIVGIEGVRKTTSTFSVASAVPFRVQPLLHKLTEDTGWGRSTPALAPTRGARKGRRGAHSTGSTTADPTERTDGRSGAPGSASGRSTGATSSTTTRSPSTRTTARRPG